MGTKIGSRVIALLGVDSGIVRSFGAGVYAGDFPLPPEAGGLNLGQTNPRIDLDGGKTVWGCECWWGHEDKVREKYPSSLWRWDAVDIDHYRAMAARRRHNKALRDLREYEEASAAREMARVAIEGKHGA